MYTNSQMKGTYNYSNYAKSSDSKYNLEFMTMSDLHKLTVILEYCVF